MPLDPILRKLYKAKDLPTPKPGFKPCGFAVVIRDTSKGTLQQTALVAADDWEELKSKTSRKWRKLDFGMKQAFTRNNQVFLVMGVYCDANDTYAEAMFSLTACDGWKGNSEETAFENL